MVMVTPAPGEKFAAKWWNSKELTAIMSVTEDPYSPFGAMESESETDEDEPSEEPPRQPPKRGTS